MPRILTEHRAGEQDDSLVVEVMDDPGPGGANHAYQLLGKSASGEYLKIGRVDFQKGPLTEGNGPNGWTNEALLSLITDRLRALQKGPYPSVQNDKALRCCEEALKALHLRTRDRRKRGVEGKLER